jgi:selenide,water dikinase
VLEQVLSQVAPQAKADPNLMVGNHSRDDAAVYRLDDHQALIATTDFFMPVVDSPRAFGRIAAANAVSDVYAMGGRPILALGILGWPQNVLSPEIAGVVLDGGREICEEAGIPLAGGHSIDSPEPIFGLAVNGLVELDRLKTNAGSQPGDRLLLTKPLGVGVYTTAQKRGLSTEEEDREALEVMMELNVFGRAISDIGAVHALTDVTGFGLLGHLREMCAAAGLSARITWDSIPLLSRAIHFAEKGAVPGGTARNLESLAGDLEGGTLLQRTLLADPQTSGGLLMAVGQDAVGEVLRRAESTGIDVQDVGEIVPQKGPMIHVR